ncbi:MAG: hypothetical protein MUO72_00565 [Bacteroidales bacterium]|nr:hypothetical protein [Bacteroidales bacterium]
MLGYCNGHFRKGFQNTNRIIPIDKAKIPDEYKDRFMNGSSRERLQC